MYICPCVSYSAQVVVSHGNQYIMVLPNLPIVCLWDTLW